MDLWCAKHRASYVDGANESSRTLDLLFELSKDPAYAKARAHMIEVRDRNPTSTEVDKLQQEANERFVPACCYLGEAKLLEMFGDE